MKLNSIKALAIFICLLVLIVLAAIPGCLEQLAPQPELHPTAGASLMFIPEGCKIGNTTTSENGIYISESELIEIMIQQREEEEREQRGRHIQR